VPEDIAILGVGNDEFWIDFGETPLSSIKLASHQTGYDAARLLHDLMTGREAGSPLRFPEGAVYEVATRKSTDIIYVSDPAVAKAAAFIREHATQAISVGDVVRASGISRVVLQKRFKAAVGRSMLAEIQRIRIELAKTLLRTTDAKMDTIAERCQFTNAQRFCTLFRKLAGQPPGHYRRAMLRTRTGERLG
jgi:LacI family transcriptional regulator